MIVAIIAGGSGTRLWPLSTPEYPKHLLKVNGGKRSLLQATYDRAKRLGSEVYVISERSHAHHVKDQLSEIDTQHLIIEPARRGTASCIIAGLAHIARRHDHTEPIASIHADHYIRDMAGFLHSFKIANRLAKREKRIVLVGIEPDHPETGFGYIEKGEVFDEEDFAFTVKSFKEKPDYDLAQAYVQSGNYLWNGGYFVGSIETFEHSMKTYAPDLFASYQKLTSSSETEYESTYLNFENIAIDYALIEKVKDLLVVPAAFDWMDLGSFSDMHKAVGSNKQGNHIHGNHIELEQVSNSFVQNYEDKPVAVIGLDNVVVVNTAHGLVVTRKDLAQKVGEVSKRFKK